MFSFTNWQLQFEKGESHSTLESSRVCVCMDVCRWCSRYYVCLLFDQHSICGPRLALLDPCFTIHILLQCSDQTTVSRFCIDTHFFTHSAPVCNRGGHRMCTLFSSVHPGGNFVSLFFAKLWNNSVRVRTYLASINCYNLLWQDNSSANPIFPAEAAFFSPISATTAVWWKI